MCTEIKIRRYGRVERNGYLSVLGPPHPRMATNYVTLNTSPPPADSSFVIDW